MNFHIFILNLLNSAFSKTPELTSIDSKSNSIKLPINFMRADKHLRREMIVIQNQQTTQVPAAIPATDLYKATSSHRLKSSLNRYQKSVKKSSRVSNTTSKNAEK